jgi:PAS domain S-box-containing protein
MAEEPKPDGESLDRLVLAERVKGLYARAALPLLTSVVNSSILAYLLWGRVGEVAIVAWLAAIYAITLARVVVWRAYWRRPPAAHRARWWGTVFTGGVALNGIAWGASGLLLYRNGDVVSQAMIVLVLGGMTAGAATSAATYFPAVLAFLVPALLPATVRLLTEGDKVHGGLGAMVTIFALAVSKIAIAGERGLIDSLRLRFKNAALVDELRVARARLTASNEDLELRVAERTSKLVETLEHDRQTDAALRRQKEVLQKIFDHSPAMLVLYGPDGRPELVNREFERLLGWTLDEHRTQDVLSQLAPDKGEREAMQEHFLRGSSSWRDFVCRTKDKRPLFVSWANVRLSDGTTIGIGQDITERRKARDALVLSARMASVGTLAAGVAHEINNPLAFVLSNLEFIASVLRSSFADLSSIIAPPSTIARLRETIGAVDDAIIGAERMRNIVRDLSTISRGVDHRGAPVDLKEVLEISIRMAANELRHRAQVVREFGVLPPVVGHGDRLGQVFLNLLVNAAQAIPVGDATRNEVRIVARTDPQGRAVVEVHDTGAGIPRDVLPRILDPFFTTKPFGQGTGLGLSICHGIVSGLGGEIQVESELGKGSVFRVVLPARPPQQGPRWIRPQMAATTIARARLLVVDDEPRVGKAVERMMAGTHEVVVETRAQEALSRIVAGENFDVILCDLMMPDVTGMEFVEQLSRVSAMLAERVAFTTGGAFTENARQFLERTPNRRIAKPFAKHELDSLLETMLRERRS